MTFRPGRLRQGEVVAGFAAVALLICMFLLPWWGLSGRFEQLIHSFGLSATVNAWHSLSAGRWLMLVTCVTTLALVWVQGTRRGPALPASFSVFATVLGIVTALELIYRVLFDGPYSSPLISTKYGAYLGLISSLVLAFGSFRSLRAEDPPDPERNAIIRKVRIPSAGSESHPHGGGESDPSAGGEADRSAGGESQSAPDSGSAPGSE